MKSKKLTLALRLTVAAALLLCFALPCLFVSAATPNVAYAAAGNYYSGITATGGSALSAQLHDLIVSSRTKYSSYDECRDKAKTTDPGSTSSAVMEFYTHEDIVTYVGGSGGKGTWNREHVWAQSLSKTTSNKQLWGTGGAGGDLHHIRPAEKQLNQDRGNQRYGEPSSKSPMYAYNLPNKGDVLGGYSDGSTFEPLDFAKGDTARIIMYVYVHYSTLAGGSVSSQTAGELPITNIVAANSEAKAWELLLKWNKLDPVDDIERNRNEEVYKIQGNRNPFIDNESYADAIWGNGTAVDPGPVNPTLTSLSLTPNAFSLDVGGTQTLNVTATPSNVNVNVNWSSSNTSVATVVNGKVTAIAAGTAVITATSADNANIKATATVTVNQGRAIKAIELLGGPVTTQYQAGQTFDPTGITIKVTYEDGTVTNLNPVDDVRFEWLDADSGQKTLSTSTTKIKCKTGTLEAVGNFTITVAAAPDNIGKFVDAVAKVSTETTLQGRFDAIKAALELYNETQKHDSEKNDTRVTNSYKTLLTLIDNYNKDIQPFNEGLQKASGVGGSAVCAAMLAAMALAYVLRYKFK